MPKEEIASSYKFITILKIFFIAIVSSTFVTGYMLWVNNKFYFDEASNNFSHICQWGSNELTKLYIYNENFGNIGLKNLDLINPPNISNTNNILSFQHIKNTLTKDKDIAQKFNWSFMVDSILQDQKQINELESEYNEKLNIAISPLIPANLKTLNANESFINVEDNNKFFQGIIYNKVYNKLNELKNDKLGDLVSLTIKLGEVDLKSLKSLRKQKLIAINPSYFKQTNTTPNAILFEGNYKKTLIDKNIIYKSTVQRTCIVINSQPYHLNDSTLILNFPQGSPSSIKCFADLMNNTAWLNSGKWYQAVDGDIPGLGVLSPPIKPLLGKMNPSQSVQTLLYHWLRQLGSDIDINQLENCLHAKWILIPNTAKYTLPFNSCITYDNPNYDDTLPGLNQSKGFIQEMIKLFFNYKFNFQYFLPLNTLPISINNFGNCIIPDSKAIFPDTTVELLTQIAKTYFFSSSSINSLNQLINKHQYLLSTINNAGQSNNNFNSLQDKRALLLKIINKEKFLYNNLNKVFNQNQNLYTNLLNTAGEGYFKIPCPINSYYLNKNNIFIPFYNDHINFYDILNINNDSQSLKKIADYFDSLPLSLYQTDLSVVMNENTFLNYLLKKYNTNLNLSNIYNKFLNNSSWDNQINPYCIILDSHKFTHPNPDDNFDNSIILKYQNPYNNLNKLPQNSLFYNSHSCLTDINKYKILWSIAIIDFIGCTNKDNKILPIQASDNLWYQNNNLLNNQAPGLAGIVNVYMPLLDLKQLPTPIDQKCRSFIPTLKAP